MSIFGMHNGWQPQANGWAYQQPQWQQPAQNQWQPQANNGWYQQAQPNHQWSQQANTGWYQQPQGQQWANQQWHQPQQWQQPIQQPQWHWWNPWSWNQPRISVRDLVNQRLQNMERYIKGQLFNLLGISEYQFEQFKNSLQAREVFNKVDVDSYYKILDCHNTIPYALWVAISQMLMQHNMDPTRIAIFASHNLSPACALGQGNWN